MAKTNRAGRRTGSGQQAAGSGRSTEEQRKVEAIVDKMMNELCTVRQAAEILGVQVYQIHQLIEDKRIDAVQLDGWFWVVHKPSLFEYLKTKSRKGRPPSSKPKI